MSDKLIIGNVVFAPDDAVDFAKKWEEASKDGHRIIALEDPELDRIKELEALAQTLVGAMKDAHPYVEDDAKRAGIGNMIVEAAKLGIK